jgi:hypothetical protein
LKFDFPHWDGLEWFSEGEGETGATTGSERLSASAGVVRIVEIRAPTVAPVEGEGPRLVVFAESFNG